MQVLKKLRRENPQRLVDRELERVRARLSRQAVLLRSGLGAIRAEPLLQAEGLGREKPSASCSCQTKRFRCGQCRSGIAVQNREVWATVAAMQEVAEYAGAPLAGGCDSLAAALGELLLLRKRRRILLAGPKNSVVMIASLPFLALGLGHLLGFNPTAVLLQPLGWLLLFSGGVFFTCGAVWIRHLIRAAEQEEKLTGFECEMLVLALRGGMPLPRARKLVADAICGNGCHWLHTDELADQGAAGQAAALLATTGTGASQLLLETAARARRHALESLEAGAEKLSGRVLLPLGVCILPAFVLVGVVPVVFAMFSGL